MMYNKKLVASIKSGGKIMRENGETVYLPFGGEYSILLKNLNTTRALVNIEVDGQDVVDGGLVISPNQTVDLERFIVNGNLNEGPRFKFIEKTGEISDHRGDRVEDGIIRVTYQFEAQPIAFPTVTYYYDPWDSGYNPKKPTVYGGTSGTTTGSKKMMRNVSGGTTSALYSSNVNVGASIDGTPDNSFQAPEQEVYTAGLMDIAPQNDNGITVHGNKSTQKFQTTTIGMLELEKHVICLNLKGQVGDHTVTAPVTVSRKIECGTCGKKNPSANNCCSKCGTSLTYQY
jgi:hypothetical protein